MLHIEHIVILIILCSITYRIPDILNMVNTVYARAILLQLVLTNFIANSSQCSKQINFSTDITSQLSLFTFSINISLMTSCKS